jgi:DNA-binding NarL/FixJ family response regulator
MEDHATIRVVVVDDHDVVRSGIINWISAEPDIDVVASDSTGQGAIECVKQHRPDVLLIDLHLPDMRATDVAKVLRSQDFDTCIIIMTGYEKNRVRQVLDAGANGYLSKEDKREVVLDAIRWGASRQPGVWVSPSALQTMLEKEREIREADLTKSELQVLGMIDQPNPVICKSLGIIDGTLRNHLSNIYFKLRVPGRAEAIEKAKSYGLVY